MYIIQNMSHLCGGKCTIEMPAGDVEQPIVCLVRNLSPIGRLLNRSAFDFIMKSHPTAMVQESSQEDIHELLKVEIGECLVKLPVRSLSAFMISVAYIRVFKRSRCEGTSAI